MIINVVYNIDEAVPGCNAHITYEADADQDFYCHTLPELMAKVDRFISNLVQE